MTVHRVSPDLPAESAERTDRRFQKWMRAVDECLDDGYGMTSDDLPDCPYRDWFDDGVTPRVAAKRAARNAME